MRNMRMHVIAVMSSYGPRDVPRAAETWVATALDNEIKILFKAIAEDRIAIEYVDCGYNFNMKEAEVDEVI